MHATAPHLCRRDFTAACSVHIARQSLPLPVLPSSRRWAFLAGKVLRYGARALALLCRCLCVYAGGRRTRKRPRAVTAAAAHYTG